MPDLRADANDRRYAGHSRFTLALNRLRVGHRQRRRRHLGEDLARSRLNQQQIPFIAVASAVALPRLRPATRGGQQAQRQHAEQDRVVS